MVDPLEGNYSTASQVRRLYSCPVGALPAAAGGGGFETAQYTSTIRMIPLKKALGSLMSFAFKDAACLKSFAFSFFAFRGLGIVGPLYGLKESVQDIKTG